MGPIWDFNLAFGNANYCQGNKATGWGYKFNSICSGDVWQVPFWWDRLMESEYFKNKLKNRWVELRQAKLSNITINNLIDSHVKYHERKLATFSDKVKTHRTLQTAYVI